MKKIVFSILVLFLLSALIVPVFASAIDPIVPQTCSIGTPAKCCGDNPPCKNASCPCGIGDFFQLLVNIYKFIVVWLATPLGIIAIMVGGIMIMVSAGNPNLMGTGKKILYAAIIGLILAYGSYAIINFILKVALGYNGAWDVLPK